MKLAAFVAHCCLTPLTAVLFFLVGGAKLLSAFGFVGSAKSLSVPDPVFGIPFWLLMVWAGTAEVAAAVFCLLSKIRLHRVYSLFWLTLALLLYRTMYWFSTPGEPCPCGVGAFLDFVGIGRENGDVAAMSILTFALIVSLAGWLTVKQQKIES